MTLSPSTHNASENIDAAIFSGDEFIDPQARAELRRLMARWERGLAEHDRTFPSGSPHEPLPE